MKVKVVIFNIYLQFYTRLIIKKNFFQYTKYCIVILALDTNINTKKYKT